MSLRQVDLEVALIGLFWFKDVGSAENGVPLDPADLLECECETILEHADLVGEGKDHGIVRWVVTTLDDHLYTTDDDGE